MGRTWRVALAAVCLSAAARADEEHLSPTVQAVMLKKIFQFDRQLEGRAVKVLVLHPDDAPAEAERVAAALAAVSVEAKVVKASAAGSVLEEGGVLYAAPGAMSAAVKALAIKSRVLTVSGEPQAAENGEVSVALGKKPDGKPEIVINLKSVRDEKHEIASSLMSLARVVR